MRGYLDTNGTLEIHSIVLFVNLAHNTECLLPQSLWQLEEDPVDGYKTPL